VFSLYILFNMWTTIIIFFIVLFIYIHVQHQWKTGEDIDIYEYDYTSYKALQEITQYKQPVLFALEMPSMRENPKLDSLNVKDVRDYQSSVGHVDSIQLSSSSARGLLDTDTKSVFYSDRNGDAISKSETWTHWFESMDPFLKPSFTLYKEYDVLYGSRKCRTVTTYNRESHTYLYLPPETNETHVRIKMTPWRNRNFLDPIEDYTYYEFWSKVNLFEANDRYKSLDFILNPRSVLYIPPYWFYSIEFQNKRNEVCMAKYTTGANFIANMKHIGMFYLQQQNIQEKWWKPLANTEVDILPIEPDKEENPIDDVSQNTILEEKKTVVESLVDELKPKI